MKKVLKGWLIDNSVTTDNKTDKILLLASAGSLTLDDVLEEMYKQDTGLRPETMRHSVTLYHRIVMDLILNGYSVNTGLFRAVPQLKGVVEGGVWNKENNSIYVSFTQDKALREAIAKTVVEILGEKSNIMYILETEDRKTGLKGDAEGGWRPRVGRCYADRLQRCHHETDGRPDHHQQPFFAHVAPAG